MEIQARYREAFLRLLYPSRCALCETLLELEENGLCRPCLDEFAKFQFFPSEERVRTPLRGADEAWAVMRYEGPVRELLHQIKFERRRELLKLFIPFCREFLKRRPELADYGVLVPIPLDPRRLWQREFNQSGIIARALFRLFKEEFGKPPLLLSRTLIKVRSTPPQSLLGRPERKTNLSGTFRVVSPKNIRGRSVLLIDDIFTTGSTLEEAARTLKEAGAEGIGYFALTRALLR